MAVSFDYKRGYNTGYKNGFHDGARQSTAATVMKRDIIYIFGIMCLVLKRKRKWKPDSIQKLCEDIMSEWSGMPADNTTGNLGPETISLEDYVDQECGVQLQMMADYIVDEC